MRKLLVGCVAICLACSAFAGVEQGAIEVGGMATYTKYTGDLDMSMMILNIYCGYFVTDQVQVKGVAVVFDTDNTDPSGQVGVGADYFFDPAAEMSPYAGGSVTLPLGDIGDVVDMYVEGHGGVKYFVSESTSVNGELRYSMGLGGNADVGELMALLGLSVYL